MRKLLVVLAFMVFALLAVAPAAAIVAEYNVSSGSGGGGLSLRSHILFNATVYELQNMTTLSQIDHRSVYAVRPTSDTSYSWTDGSAPFVASISDNTGYHEVGTGTISSYFISNSSTYTAYYRVVLDFDSWDKSAVTGGLTGQKHINLSYDYASLKVVPSYRNDANSYPPKSLNYNTSAFLSYETPTDPFFYVPMGQAGYSIFTTYSHTPTPLVVDFNCNAAGNTPSPHALFCSKAVTGGTVVNQSWTLNYPGGGQLTSSNSSLAVTVSELGLYGVNLTACSASQCGSAAKPNLFNLTAAGFNTTGISFWVHIVDPIKSAKIAGSGLIVTNTTHPSSYRVLTSSSGSFFIDSTVYGGLEPITSGQYINLTGSATGYLTANQTVSVPYNGWEYNLNLIATSDVPTGANATLVVNVINSYTAEGIDGATLTISNNTIPYSSSKLSNVGGSATFSSIPAGTYQITATKTGYQSSTTSWPTEASVVTNAYIGILPIGATPVVTGTSGEPLYDENGNPIIGYDLSGNPITAGPTQDARTTDEKAEGMMSIFYENGEGLITLFILFTIMYMLKGIVW